VLAKEIERVGIPTAIVTALPTIAQMIGANRIVRGTSITTPVGDPARGDGERAYRRRIVERCIEMLQADVEPGTVWEVES
jgi:glycine/betaine/sarcosine/D-proline reductase family selenoprotein B